VGYSIGIFADGSSWQIDRSTQNLSLGIVERIYGSGNFSRYNYIKDISGLEFSEKASAVRGGNVSMNESTRFVSIEGPVFIKYALRSSYNRLEDDEEKQKLTLKESAKVEINEYWPVFFLNYKSISYFGRGIKTSERYDDNGESVSTHSDSWMLQKQSLYNSFSNRTDISVAINPSSVLSTRNSNSSSQYLLDLKSIGSISSIDIKKTRPSDEVVSNSPAETLLHISQDYRGGVEMRMKYASKGYLSPPLNESDEYIPCCMDSGLNSIDNIFNCSCIS
jgi:hypothetical protein